MTVLYGKILEKKGYAIEMLLLQIKKNAENHLIPFIPKHWNVATEVRRFRYLIVSIYSYLKRSNPDTVDLYGEGYMPFPVTNSPLIVTDAAIFDELP